MMALLNREPGVDPKRHREEAPSDAPTTSRDDGEVQTIEPEPKAVKMEPVEEEAEQQQRPKQAIPKEKKKKERNTVVSQDE
ncbi:hypothetical protein Aduo_018519 [Ancylostoma duodenale]